MSTADVRLGDRSVSVIVDADTRVRIDDTAFTIDALGRGLYRVSDGTRHWSVAVAGPADNRWVFVDGRVAQVEVGSGSLGRRGRRTASHDLVSPMPATVIRVLVGPGAKVSRGDTLMVLEAMKMELPVRSPRDGVVRAVLCKPGELVQAGVHLLDLE